MSLVLYARQTLNEGLQRLFSARAKDEALVSALPVGVRLSGVAVQDLQLHGEKFGLGVQPGLVALPGIGPSECLVFGSFRSAAVDLNPMDLRVRNGKVFNEAGEEAVLDEARVLRRSLSSRCALPLIWCVASRRNGAARSKAGVLVVCGSARYLAMVISREFAKMRSHHPGA